MSKHLIFMIHGMGSFKKGWSAPYFDQLRNSYKSYERLSFREFDDNFEPVELTYDDVFDELREGWKNQADKVIKTLTDNGFEETAAGRLAEIASGANGDDFVRTHVLDVILYRFLRDVAERIRVRMMKDIQVKLNSFPVSDIPRYSIIAHSLGTAVIGEAMHLWMTDRGWRGTPFGSRFRPQNLFMIANVGRVLWSLGGQFYRDTAVKAFPTEGQGACAYYGNYSHPLDPFTQVKPFDPPPRSWFLQGVVREEVYGCPPIAVDDIRDVDVHGLNHYLAHPLVHVDIFLRLRQSTRLVSTQELNDHLADYYKTTLAGKTLVDVRKKLTQFTLSDTESWSGILDGISEFRNLVEAFRRDGK